MNYCEWAKPLGYHASASKAEKIHAKALESIPTLNKTDITKMILEACAMVKNINATLCIILAKMTEIATEFPEYNVVQDLIHRRLNPVTMLEHSGKLVSEGLEYFVKLDMKLCLA